MREILPLAAQSIQEAGGVAVRAARRVAGSLPGIGELARSSVELTQAETAVRAGRVLVKTAGELLGSLIDIIA
jgi:hypothetical protein